MKLEYRHNNSFDTIILVDDDGTVRSDWPVGPQELSDFCDCSQDPDDWDDRFGAEHTPGEYGELLAVREGHELHAVDAEKWSRQINLVTA